MPIKYDKLIKLMQDNGITSYTLKKDKIIGQATYKKIMEGGDIDTRTIAKMCELLNCQPGDLLEYIPENDWIINRKILYIKIPLHAFIRVRAFLWGIFNIL